MFDHLKIPRPQQRFSLTSPAELEGLALDCGVSYAAAAASWRSWLRLSIACRMSSIWYPFTLSAVSSVATAWFSFMLASSMASHSDTRASALARTSARRDILSHLGIACGAASPLRSTSRTTRTTFLSSALLFSRALHWSAIPPAATTTQPLPEPAGAPTAAENVEGASGIQHVHACPRCRSTSIAPVFVSCAHIRRSARRHAAAADALLRTSQGAHRAP